MSAQGLFERAAASRMAGLVLSASGDEAGTATASGRVSTLTLRLEPDVEAAAKARAALERLDGQLERELLQDMHLLVTELVTNSVRHADASGQPVVVEVAVRGEHVHLAVEDGGTGFEPQPRSEDSPRDSGWGLHLVDRLASRWGVSGQGRTRVWLELARRPSVEAA